MRTPLEGFTYTSDTWPTATKTNHAVVFGMGGSSLSGRLITPLPDAPRLTLVTDYAPSSGQKIHEGDRTIFMSYSGNTEEILEAIKYHATLDSAVITTGGKLLEYAREHNITAYVIEDTGLEPRDAVGQMTSALLHALHMQESLHRITSLVHETKEHPEAVLRIASMCEKKTPLIYASARSLGIAYYLKVVLNETAKCHAFINMLPELCHNELEAFQSEGAHSMVPLFITDPSDHPRVALRASIIEDILKEHGIDSSSILLQGESLEARLLEGVLFAHTLGDVLAKQKGLTSHKTPLIAKLKDSLNAS